MLTVVHFALLHEFGSNNGLGVHVRFDHIPFMPYYGVKDAFSIILVLIVFFIFVTWCPDKLGHSDNFILANSLVTPAHIVPEWYFLPLYAILRSVTNKLLGISLIALAIVCILLVPFFCKGFIIRSTAYRPYYGILIWFFFMICLTLGWIGSLPVMTPYFEVGLYATILFFVYFVIIFPVIGVIEKLVYELYARRSLEEEDKSSISGARLFSNIIKFNLKKTNIKNLINISYN